MTSFNHLLLSYSYQARLILKHLCSPPDLLGSPLVPRSMASDGEFLYLYTSKGLLKIGSGYRNTMKGLIYQHAPDFFPDDKGWLGYANVSTTGT